MTSSPRPLAAAIDGHDNGFNLVRLVCACMVVVFHAWSMNTVQPGTSDPVTRMLIPTTDLGSLAVGVFFLISGIFITQSWMRDPHLGRFVVRRVARIVPGLFVCLVLTTAVALGWFSTRGWRGLLDADVWRYILGNTTLHRLLYIIPPQELRLAGVLGDQPLNGPLWTLYWEGRMYAMVALLGLAAVLPLRTWLRGAAVFLLVAANAWPDVAAGYVWEVRMWSMFLIGMLLATLAADVRIGPLAAACAIAFLAMNATRWASLAPGPFTWFGLALAAGTAAMAVGTGAPAPRWVRRHDYSYGVYIYHWPLLLMLRAALPPLSPVAATLATIAVSLAAAAFSWHCVEAPAMRFTRALLSRRVPKKPH